MEIKKFAEKYRVKVRHDSCNDEIIPGKKFCNDMPDRICYRSHVFDYGDGRFGVCLMFNGNSKKWGYARTKLEAAGFTIRQNGDTEGTALFDPANAQQAILALDVCGIKRIRQITESTKERLLKAGQATRLISRAPAQLGPLFA